jgi:uncharacterized protein YigE (DUF2233 family)
MAINLTKDDQSDGNKLYYYADSESNTIGPIQLDKLILIIDEDTLIYSEGNDWTEAKNVPEVARLILKNNNKIGESTVLSEPNKVDNNIQVNSNNNVLNDDYLAKKKKDRISMLIIILIINVVFFTGAYFLMDKFNTNIPKALDPVNNDSLPKDSVVIKDTIPTSGSNFVFEGNNSIRFKGNSYSIFSINFNDELAEHFEFVQTSGNTKVSEFVLRQKNKYRNQNSSSLVFNDDDDFFAITGAMYDGSDNLPPGLVINKNNEIKSLNFNSGIDGNFYMQPNGVFYINKQDVGVVESNSYSNNNNYFAIQSGPMLIENSQIPSVVNPTSTNKRKRCAVGVSGIGQNKVVYFVCSNNDVSFYDLASFFRDKYNCSDALHLESGVFPFIYWPGSSMRSKENIMNYIVVR